MHPAYVKLEDEARRNPQMTTTPSIAVLDERAVLTVAGSEARHFLHNVVTADVEGLNDGEARHAALLTPQGKILFDFFILADKERFLIDCADAEGLLRRLGLYKLRAKVDLGLEAELAVAAAWGGEAPSALPHVLAYADPRLAGFGWRLIGPLQTLKGLANADRVAYHARRIAAGLTDASDIGSGEVFPHEANLDQLGGVSFAKGCYVGQEVVSRMQHRGTARSRMVPVTITGKGEPGTPVTAGERAIGRLLSTAGSAGLALIRLDRAEAARREGLFLKAGPAQITVGRPDWARWTVKTGEDD
jgi:folate-binding protein YgfZ